MQSITEMIDRHRIQHPDKSQATAGYQENRNYPVSNLYITLILIKIVIWCKDSVRRWVKGHWICVHFKCQFLFSEFENTPTE